MDSPERAAVRRALDSLKPHLAAFVEKQGLRVEGAPRGYGQAGPDIQALLKACIIHWDTSLRSELPRAARSYLHELIDIRNRWAHEEPFTAAECARALDTVRMLGGLIGMTEVPSVPKERTEAASGDVRPKPPTPKDTGRRESQRDVMRRIFLAAGRDHERAIQAYAAAERLGEAQRKRDKHGTSAEQYARALLMDGLKKGWLK